MVLVAGFSMERLSVLEPVDFGGGIASGDTG